MTYPKADTKSQWFQDDYPGSVLNLKSSTMVFVIHTTEGATWPGYSGGATAPNITGLPPIKGKQFGAWRQHFPDDRSARALRNESGGVQTNTLNCFQVELIGTCDPKHAKSWPGVGVAGKDYVYWPNANDEQLAWVGDLIAYHHKSHGLVLNAPRVFKAYPGSYGDNGVRLSFSAWNNVTGVVGHQHVPENVHGDPGNINIAKILSYAKSTTAAKSEPRKPHRGKYVQTALENLKKAGGQKGTDRRSKLVRTARRALNKITPK